MSISKDKTIGVFFGGRSPEHDVSIITADLVISGLNEMGYDVQPIYIDKSGRWYINESVGSIDFFKSNDVEAKLSQLREYTLDLQQSNGQMVFYSKKGFLGSDEITVDIAFPALHGPNGEDGAAQGLFALCNIPFVGVDQAAAARTMDKAQTKLLYQRFQIPTTEFTYLMQSEWETHREAIVDEGAQMGFPLFVKPARAGSSIGITRVEDESELEEAVDTALHYDTKALIEKAVTDVADLTVALLGNENPETSLVQESQFTEGFFSYEDKYLKDGGAQLGEADKNLVIPADLDEAVTDKVKEMAADIYRLFECSGTARVDFLYDRAEEKLYANEINPMPGTLYHHLWEKSGVSISELLDKLLQLAVDRYQDQQRITTTFETEVLAHAKEGSQKLQNGN